MKKPLFTRPLLILLLGLTCAAISLAQNEAPPTVYSEVYYHKLKPGKTMAEARAIEAEWKKLHQTQMLDKSIVGWYMLSKGLSSNPAEQTYDYITIKNFSSMGLMDDAYPAKVLETVYGPTYKAKWADLLKRTEAVQAHGKMEIWKTLDFVSASKPLAESPIWVFDFMKVKNNLDGEYVALEKTFKNLHKERIAMNNINGWVLAALMYPGGTENGYGYATVNQYGTMKELADGRYGEAFAKAMPGQDVQKLVDQVYKTRDIVRQEIYFLQDYAVPAPVQTMK